MQHSATHCNTMQCTATHCNTLQHTATHCNTLQHTATHCNIYTCAGHKGIAIPLNYCNTLQHTATHCNTLQHTATHTHVQGTKASRFLLITPRGKNYGTSTISISVRDVSSCMTWLIHVSDITHSCKWHDSFINLTPPSASPFVMWVRVWHDSFM